MARFANSVRFHVKEGHREEFIERIKGWPLPRGVLQHILVETGDSHFCTFATWESEQHLIDARPAMIALLDGARHMLHELSPELGVTDPVSGAVLFAGTGG